jgi:DNA-binding FadR family transcriptional regulator
LYGSVAVDQPVRVVRAYEQLATVLRDRIASGALPPGERLPSETAIAQQAGVSRSTVREALRKLEEAGFVERKSPKAMVVRSQTTNDSAYRELKHALRRQRVTFRHLVEALLTIEPELTRLAAERADRSDVQELRAIVDAQHAALEDFAEWSRLDEELHLTIADLSDNPALVIARMPITQVLLPTVSRFMSSVTQTTHGTRYHERILAEIEAHDPGLAAAVMRRHVNDFSVAWQKAGLDPDSVVADMGDDAGSSL